MKAIATLSVLTALLVATAAQAQVIDAATKKTAVERAASAMRTAYVFPEVGAKVAEKIEKAHAAGEYDSITDGAVFAEKLTADMRAIAPDGHLRVRSSGGAPPPAQGAPRPERFTAEAGIVRADRLADGIGYIEIAGFPGPAAFKPSLDRAMTALAGSRALIIDLRRNGGGSPDGVAYLTSFFMDPAKRTLINEFHNRDRGAATVTVRPSYSSPTPVSFFGKPVYLLTSKRTFSGGEEFAYNMQAFKLATLIGETTGGGANGGGGVNLSPQLSMFVPNFHPINPVTKTNWEGVGVIPELATPSADALKAALQRLGQSPASGEVSALSTAKLFEPRTARQPGSEAALRRMIDEISRGAPNYDLMAPGLAEATRTQLPGMQQRFADLGALELVRFMTVTDGMDSYELKFAKGVLEYQLALDEAGKVGSARMRPLAALTPTTEERMAVFRANDPDGDGKIDKAGYGAVLTSLGFGNQLETLFVQRDINKDGFVSADEYRNPIPQ